MTVSPTCPPALPDPATNPAYDWEIVATIAGRDFQRGTGRSWDYNRARKAMTESLNRIPAGIRVVGLLKVGYLLSGLPGTPVARVVREVDGSIEWTTP